jgi:hypothetical protein
LSLSIQCCRQTEYVLYNNHIKTGLFLNILVQQATCSINPKCQISYDNCIRMVIVSCQVILRRSRACSILFLSWSSSISNRFVSECNDLFKLHATYFGAITSISIILSSYLLAKTESSGPNVNNDPFDLSRLTFRAPVDSNCG